MSSTAQPRSPAVSPPRASGDGRSAARAGAEGAGAPTFAWLSRVGTGAVLLLLAVALVAPDLVVAVGIPLALVGIVLGIPHGAVDHMVPFWTSGQRPSVGGLGRVLTGYLATAMIAVLALVLAPALAVTSFLIVSAIHFGRAEVVFAAERSGRAVPGWRSDSLAAAAHGLVVVVFPLALWHEQTVLVLGSLSDAYAGAVPTWILALAAVVVASCAVAAVLELVRSGRHRQAGELVLVAALFAVVPPLAAFGVYFGAWHAMRHTSRLLAIPDQQGQRLSEAQSWRRYAAHAAAPTLISLVALTFLLSRQSEALVAGALAILLALTFPHVHTVAALDRWASSGPRPSA